jgi:3-hydroxy-9,10-secoandrosta-1,3,5(10)-triene-9,17-dione monooxygenase reductase component
MKTWVMAISKQEFKNALTEFVSGVTVITYKLGSEMGGLTVSSFSSLSLEPPLILFCINNQSTNLSKLQTAGSFAVNILGSDAEIVSNQFATPDINKHDLIEKIGFTTKETGSPLLIGCIALLDCKIENIYAGGDHSILVGHVQFATSDTSKRPLIYFKRKYYSL